MEDSFEKARRFPRVSVRVPVRVSTIDPEKDPRTGRLYFRASHELCSNLSEGGAFIHTPDPPEPGRRLLVEIHVPHHGPVETIGRVAWARKVIGAEGALDDSGVGVEFLGPEETRSLLEELLAEGA